MHNYLAIYLRLSHEDDDLKDESNSIINQRYLIYDYISKDTELQNYEIKEYVDDGFSGKNFERPGIETLFENIRNGEIYGIIVKDLSRFGRDYIMVGDYIEKIFPTLHIRFIAINNEYDSYNKDLNFNMDISFNNLLYDYYSADISVKIKKVLLSKKKAGEAICAKAPYGYKKSKTNHNLLLIDEEAATIVQLIFSLYKEKKVIAEVARYLNLYKIPTPQQYAEIKNPSFRWRYKTPVFWNGNTIKRILTDQVYLGNLVYHKREVLEIGSKKEKPISRSEWLVSENAHDAIISKETFNAVKELINSKSKSKNTKTALDPIIYCEGTKRKRGTLDSPIKGLVKCGGCKHTLVRRSRYFSSYYCRYYYSNKHSGCCNSNVKEVELQEVILSAIKEHIKLLADLKYLYSLTPLYKKFSLQNQSKLDIQ